MREGIVITDWVMLGAFLLWALLIYFIGRGKLAYKEDEIKKLEAELEKPPEDILICKCGWWGKMEQQDALGSECGCCPDCGNEALVWLSKLQGRFKELGIANKQLLELSESLDEHPEGYEGPCLCKLCRSYG
ncbi:hypothetical protein LCGC14_0390820 [marine sediment metagenome]|uniref:Uncharacterized protein n=1 Tax=marine sediment metagenome TaxID=412755 RepID=A0A0F9THS5_9ZZZZ